MHKTNKLFSWFHHLDTTIWHVNVQERTLVLFLLRIFPLIRSIFSPWGLCIGWKKDYQEGITGSISRAEAKKWSDFVHKPEAQDHEEDQYEILRMPADKPPEVCLDEGLEEAVLHGAGEILDVRPLVLGCLREGLQMVIDPLLSRHSRRKILAVMGPVESSSLESVPNLHVLSQSNFRRF